MEKIEINFLQLLSLKDLNNNSETIKMTVADESSTVMFEQAEAQTDRSLAKKFYENAALGGHPEAMGKLADIMEGDGQYVSALKWHLEAADRGFVPSMKALVEIYEGGLITNRNMGQALAWKTRAYAATKFEDKSDLNDEEREYNHMLLKKEFENLLEYEDELSPEEEEYTYERMMDEFDERYEDEY